MNLDGTSHEYSVLDNDTYYYTNNGTDWNPLDYSLADTIEYYRIVLSLLLIPSVSCSIIHFYKFFKSTSPQSLANKNLTFYCILLFANNVHNWLIDSPFGPEYAYIWLLGYKICLSITIYILTATTVFKFIIALDICLCFRKIALYLQRPSGPQNMKFFVYCILGTGAPWLPTILFYMDEDYAVSEREWYFTTIRIARLIPIIGAFWYIRSASINKNELRTNFSLHIRFLMMIGGFSAIASIAEITTKVIYATNCGRQMAADVTSLWINNCGASLEGIFIGVLFTFKKDTFKPVSG